MTVSQGPGGSAGRWVAIIRRQGPVSSLNEDRPRVVGGLVVTTSAALPAAGR